MTVFFDNAQQRLTVSGDLTLDSVQQKMTETELVFKDNLALEIDLAEVSKSDSAGLALLIHWLRKAHQIEKKLVYTNMPTQMLAMARACGLEEILPLQTK